MTLTNTVALLFYLLGNIQLAVSFAPGGDRRPFAPQHGHSSCLTTVRTTSNTAFTETTSSPCQSSSRRQWLSNIAGGAVATMAVMVAAPAPSAAVVADILKTGPVCDPSVSVWKRDNRILYLLGTAHISEQSANVAGELVRQAHPNAVFVELDLRRLGGVGSPPIKPGDATTSRLVFQPVGEDGNASPTRIVVPRVLTTTTTTTTTTEGVSAAGTAVSAPTSTALMASADAASTTEEAPTPAAPPQQQPQQPKERRGLLSGVKNKMLNMGAAAVGSAIRGMYKNLGDAGFNPGEEFTTAMKVGQEQGADIVLGDQDVRITLQRLTQALAETDMDKLLNPDNDLEQSMRELLRTDPPEITPPMLKAGGADNSSMDNAQFKQELSTFVETLKSRDRVRTIMGKLKEVAPELVNVMLTERDAYMATGLDTLNEYEVITAVMGIAHQDGVENNLRARGWQPVPIACQKVIA